MLFQPFFRADDRDVEVMQGVGLSLAVSKKLMEAQGGGIDAASLPARGSVFTMWLPLEITVPDRRLPPVKKLGRRKSPGPEA